jgi:hypothetical protein
MPAGPGNTDWDGETRSRCRARDGRVVAKKANWDASSAANWESLTSRRTPAAAASSANRTCCASASGLDGVTRYALVTPSNAASRERGSRSCPRRLWPVVRQSGRVLRGANHRPNDGPTARKVLQQSGSRISRSACDENHVFSLHRRFSCRALPVLSHNRFVRPKVSLLNCASCWRPAVLRPDRVFRVSTRNVRCRPQREDLKRALYLLPFGHPCRARLTPIANDTKAPVVALKGRVQNLKCSVHEAQRGSHRCLRNHETSSLHHILVCCLQAQDETAVGSHQRPNYQYGARGESEVRNADACRVNDS